MKTSAWKGEGEAIKTSREEYGWSSIINDLKTPVKKSEVISLKSYNTISGAKSNNPIKSKGKMPNMFATKKIKDKQEKKLAEKDATFLFKEGIKSC